MCVLNGSALQANFILSCTFILIGIEGYGLGHHNAALPQHQAIQALKVCPAPVAPR